MESLLALLSYVKPLGIMFYLVSPNDLHIEDDYAFHQVPRYIDQAVPFFLLFILFEELLARLRGKNVNAIRDTLCSVSLGMVQQVFGLFILKLSLIPYAWVFDKYRMISYFPRGWTLFLVTLFLTDFGYYAFHRIAHCVQCLWAPHSVHHSGERYNLATALRQGTFQPWTSWVFYLPLAWIGIPPAIFACHTQLNTLYQFWIHTEAVDKLPWPLEGILNTPSHHRMHHQPPGNCNYAGVFIIWDRIFGTFKDEANTTVRGVYGLAKPADTFDPFWINMLHIYRLLTVNSTSSTSGNGLGSKGSSGSDAKMVGAPSSQSGLARAISNIPLLFSPRAVHSWWPQPIEAIQGIFSFYPRFPAQRVVLPLPDNALQDPAVRKTLNSREIAFLQGREQREGGPVFAKYPLIALMAIIGWLAIFVVAYGSMLHLSGIQVAMCNYLQSSSEQGLQRVSAFVCNPQDVSLKFLHCHWTLLTVLCSFVLSSLSIHAAVMKTITNFDDDQKTK